MAGKSRNMAEQELLLPSTEYLQSGIHIGTKFRTKYMARFIYKTRPDGLSVMNLQQIDERIKIAANFLSQYEPQEILVIGRRENAWKPLKALGKATGIQVIPGRYAPGMLTNPRLDIYVEPKIIVVVDAIPDKNAVYDANRVGIPVIGVCDTNNQTNNLDLVLPANNKGKKSLGLLFYLLATGFLRKKGTLGPNEQLKETIEEFTEQ